MNKQRNDEFLDFYIKIAAAQALEKEMTDLPSCEELNEKHPPSPELRAKVDAAIHKTFRKRRRSSISKIAKRVAVIVLILLAATTIGLFSAEASRNAIFNVVQEWREGYTKINFDGSSGDEGGFNVLYPSYLPDGYVLMSAQIGETQAVVTYTNGDGILLTITQYPCPEYSFYEDNEDSGYQEALINGKKSFIFISDSEDKKSMLTWNRNNTNFIVVANIGSEDMIKIAESMR